MTVDAITNSLIEFKQSILNELSESREKIQSLEEKARRLEVRMKNIVNRGTVIALDGNQCIVEIAGEKELVTIPLRRSVQGSGNLYISTKPLVGDECLVLTWGDSDNFSQSYLIGHFTNEEFDDSIIHIMKSDNFVMQVDDKGFLKIQAQGIETSSIKVNGIMESEKVFAEEVSDQEASMSDDRNEYRVHLHDVSGSTTSPPKG